MLGKIITLDIETENTGYDVMEDNKRIISIQLWDGNMGRIYYDGAESDGIASAKKDLNALIENRAKFLGFNIKGFDAPKIKEFWGIEIPDSQIIEIGEMTEMNVVRQRLGRNRPRLVDICKLLGVECIHKDAMDRRADKFRELPEVIRKAQEGAMKWRDELGWGYDFSYNLALDRICGGMAILEAYQEFLEAQGDQSSFFHQYAMGDVHAEYELYLKLKLAAENTKESR